MLNMATRQFTSGQLLWRSLIPSSTSGFLCVVVGLALAIIHLVLLSVSVGTSLPGLLDGQWAIYYTENIVQPLSLFFTNATLNKLLVASLWGLIGLTVYLGFEYAGHAYRQAKETQVQVAMNAYGSYEERPMQQDFVRGVVWRVAMIVAAIVYVILMQPLLSHAMGVAPKIVLSQNILRDAPQALVAALIWAVFCHGLVVLLRLYTRRTRIFGDDKLY